MRAARGSGVHRTVFLALAAVALVLSAWISDDALITLRQVEMTVAGEGIVWNPGHRVQAFTHPAWFGLLAAGHWLSGSLFHMTLALSALCSLGALALWSGQVRRVLGPGPAAAGFLFLPLGSAAFLDYLASGLENPLSFLLVAGLFRLLAARPTAARDRAIWLLLAAAVLTRQDHALQLGPLAAWLLVAGGPLRQAGRALPGIILLAAWFGFATFYFGFALPNTYFAKLSTGYEEGQIAAMAGQFWRTSLAENWFTLAVIGAGVLAGLAGRWHERVLAAGILAHLFYLHTVGGDFMQGRMLTVDFLIACFLLLPAGRIIGQRPGQILLVALIALFALRAAALVQPVRDFELRTVMDERAFHYPLLGMLSPQRNWPPRRQPAPEGQAGRHVYMICGMAGYARMKAPDSIHVVDQCGLTDPFLSRMPALDIPNPRPGHFLRAVPEDYPRALAEGRADWMPGGAGPLFADVMQAATVPLREGERLAAIRRLNTLRRVPGPDPWRHPDTAPVPMRTTPGWMTDDPHPDYDPKPELR